MPNPTASDVHVNAALTNISIAYTQEAGSFVADRVFPLLQVPKQSDRYFVYDKDDFFRSEAQLRAPGTPSAGSGFGIDNTPSYFADVYAIHKDVDDQIRANSDAAINPDRDATGTNAVVFRADTGRCVVVFVRVFQRIGNGLFRIAQSALA